MTNNSYYLDERIYITLSTTASQDGLYQYNVYTLDDNLDDKLLFTGNLFLYAGTHINSIDLSDLARNLYSIESYTPTEKPLFVSVTVNSTVYTSDYVYVYPFYRYPNRKASDLDLSNLTNPSVLFSNNLELLPTYPKQQTDNLDIQYYDYLGSQTYTIDYGPIISPISDGKDLELRTGSLSTTDSTTTDIWFTSVSDQDKLTALSPFTWNYSTLTKPTHLLYVSNGQIKASRTIGSFPYSNSESYSATADNSVPYSVSVCADDQELFTPQVTTTGSILTTINTTIEQSTQPYFVDNIDGFVYDTTTNSFKSNNTYDSYNETLAIRFTDTNGDYVLELDANWDMSSSNEYSWTWTDNQELSDTYVYLEFCQFEFKIPLTYFTNSGRTYNFTLKQIDSYIYFYIQEATYDITIEQSGSLAVPVSLSDNILYYNADTRYKIDSEPFVDTDAYLSGTSDLIIGSMSALLPQGCKYMTLYKIDNETGISTYIGSASASQTLYQQFELGNTSNYHLAIVYLNPDNKLTTGYVYINPSKQYYTYTSDIMNYNTNGLDLAGIKWTFYKCTDTATKIGTFSCPKGYYLIWQDRFGSQQCQPFHMVDTYSEDIEASELTNYYGKRSIYKFEVQPKWKIQTSWITDSQYRCYESLFISPYLKLYNANEDLVYDVILKDHNYTEKTFLNQGKLFNLELTLEQDTTQNILY